MKILLATVFDYPHAGGLSTHVTTLKSGLEERGHEVDVLSFSDVSKLEQNLIVKAPSFVLNKMTQGQGIIWSHERRYSLLKALLEKEKGNYDIVNAQDTFAALAAIETGFTTVSTVHGYFSFEAISRGTIDENSKAAKWLQQKEIEGYQKSAEVITVDQRIKNYIQDVANVEGSAIKNFINIHDFQPMKERKQELREKHQIPQEKQVIFVPRRLTKKNGVTYPLLALQKLIANHPNALLIYAGSGEQEDKLKQLRKEHKLEENVKILGAIQHDLMKEYYALSDLVLVPSIYSAGVEEATSISALEAMGSGTAVIAGAVGGLKEIISDDNDGILLNVEEVDHFATAISDLLKDEEKRQLLASAARKKIENEYSHIAAAKNYEDIYTMALKNSELV